jgi:hypothetical protein
MIKEIIVNIVLIVSKVVLLILISLFINVDQIVKNPKERKSHIRSNKR